MQSFQKHNLSRTQKLSHLYIETLILLTGKLFKSASDLRVRKRPESDTVCLCFLTLCSSIHDHTDSHCFMKMLQGQLKETLFEWPDNKSQGDMVQKSQRILQENEVAYINDSIGLHRVENGSHTEGAVSLHLYSPPFQTCQTFDQRTGHRNTVKMTFWSKYGEKTSISETTVSQENN